MSYKTILIHLDSSSSCERRVALACELAKREQAHLVGVAASGLDTQNTIVVASASALLAGLQKEADEAAIQAVERFEHHCRANGLDTVDARRVSSSAVEAVLRQARYSDLVVLGQPNEKARNSPGKGFIEQVLMGSGRPVLVVPTLKMVKPIGERVIFAWDASREAARAATDAIPMLRAANLAEIVIVNSARARASKSVDPGNEIALYLSRHGVSACIHPLTSDTDVSTALLSHAHDRQADLIVMGGYGHSRIREWVMGGTTRSMLNDTTVPILMTH